MRIAYFDCFSGAGGDMILAALLDAGAPADALRNRLAGLKLDDEFQLSIDKITKQGFAATQIDVRGASASRRQTEHRHLSQIIRILDAANLPDPLCRRAAAVFTRLAEAEAAVHGTSIEKVHFHEVGAIDAIVDVVGAVVALDLLGVERVECSPIPVGSGTVHCEHGVLPVPAPATAALLRGVPLLETDEVGELITPTGAAILTTLAERFGPMPAMTLTAVGVGAGRREGRSRPNLLRVFVGDATGDTETDEVVLLEANLDDATGEVVGYVCERLLAAGALDVFATPIVMKKGRPGVQLSVLAAPPHSDELEDLLFRETTTFGVRRATRLRHKLTRTLESVATPYGPIRVKVGRRAARVVTVSPEYEDCAAAARAHNAPLREVMDAALRAWHNTP